MKIAFFDTKPYDKPSFDKYGIDFKYFETKLNEDTAELAHGYDGVCVFGKIYPVEDYDDAMKICRSLSLKFIQDTEYIESEISKFGAATQCYVLIPEHITGKTVNES